MHGLTPRRALSGSSVAFCQLAVCSLGYHMNSATSTCSACSNGSPCSSCGANTVWSSADGGTCGTRPHQILCARLICLCRLDNGQL